MSHPPRAEKTFSINCYGFVYIYVELISRMYVFDNAAFIMRMIVSQ